MRACQHIPKFTKRFGSASEQADRAMSFFGQLRERTQTAQERQRAEQEAQREREIAAVQNFIRDWVQKFQKECERRADAGHSSASMTLSTQHTLRGIYYSMDRDALAMEVAESLRNLGAQVWVGGWIQQPGFHYEFDTQISVNWGQASPSPPAAAEAHAATCGQVGSCPICMETRPVVVLVPCGHTVCSTCRGSKDLRQCPMCRRQITTATEGLFIQLA